MSDKPSDRKPSANSQQHGADIKRRDLLLGASSLLTVSAMTSLPDTARAELKEYKPGTTFPGRMGRTIGESSPAWPAPVRAKPGAPNVLFIVLDDTGFGQLGCYGSPINTPNIDKLAQNGLLYTNMHTTALCSPTRSCILTGRNHHSNAMACITEGSEGYPGANGAIPFENGFLSEILLEQGYNTYALGKWHLTPAEQISAAGPYDRWPLGRGFERYYGFLGGDTSQYYPDLVYDNHQVEPPKTPEEGYHLTPDLVDKAISFIADSKQLAPDKPFFLYFATGAQHAPHHVPKEWADKYKGKFDDGWDAYREKVFARQKELGIIPQNAVLSRHDPDVQDWSKLSADERRLYARMMEVFAGFLEHTDHHIGRLIDYLAATGELDNTLIMLISDNGASSEGGPTGSTNENKFFNNVPDDLKQNLAALDDLGGPKYFNHYAWGWTFAGNTPFKRWKRETYRGGVSDPFLVHWPKGIKAKGEIRHQYAHAIDMVPTVLDALGIEPPAVIRGVTQSPIEGVSFAHTFDDGKAASASITPSISRCSRTARSITTAGARCARSPATSFTEAKAFFGAARAHRGQAARARCQRVGALQRRGRSGRDQQPRRHEPRQADRDDRAVVRRGRQVQCAAARQPRHRALRRRASAAQQGAADLRLLSGHADGAGKRRGEGAQSRAQPHRRSRDSQGRGGGRAGLPRQQCRRLHAVRQGQQAALRPQLRRRAGIPRRVERAGAGRQIDVALRVRADRQARHRQGQGRARPRAALHQRQAGRPDRPSRTRCRSSWRSAAA